MAGKLGGLLQFRNESIDAARNGLGRIAIGLAGTFNAQHELGQDVQGNQVAAISFPSQAHRLPAP